MDYTVLLSGLAEGLVRVWWIFPLGALVACLRLPAVKGWIGESAVRLSIRMFLNSSIYTPFHDVMLETTEGITQIDHILVSPYGIFVIETKNLRGRIFGRARESHWTQKIGRKSYRFQNSLRQNYKHVQSVRRILGLRSEAVHSMVVFTGNATFKKDVPTNVVRGLGCVRYVRSFRVEIFTEEQVRYFCKQIQYARLPSDRATRKAHVRRLRGGSGFTKS